MYNNSKILAKGLRQSINEDRMIYYGIAILLVVLYHLYCQTQLAIVTPFKYGVIGVDIFLFFSGYGLCFSYEKKSLREFYKRRAKRILPIFWIHFFFTVIEYFSCGGTMFTPMEFLANFLCIPPFYGIGGTFVDWFTAAILQFYLLFPVLFYLMRKLHAIFYVFSILTVGMLMYHVDLTWQQSCFIGRMPIFLLGIAYYLYEHSKKRVLAVMLAFSFLAALALFCVKIEHKHFFFFSLICPFVIYAIYILIANRYCVGNKIVDNILSKINSIGKCSLEIYYGNGNAGIALKFCQTSNEILFFYALLTIFYSFVLTCVNRNFK